MSASLAELGEMFPQFSRDTIEDVLQQAGESAVECLLELCNNSGEEDCDLVVNPWSGESDDSTLNSGTSWTGGTTSGSPVSNQASREGFQASRGWWGCWNREEDGLSTGSEEEGEERYCESEMAGSAPVGSPGSGLSLWEEEEEVPAAGGKEASAGWDSVAEGSLSVDDWGMVPVVQAEDRPDSECSSVSLYGCKDSNGQKLRFLTNMFAEYGLGDAVVEGVLDSVGGNLDSAVDELLEITRDVDEELPASLESGGEPEIKHNDAHGEEVVLRPDAWSSVQRETNTTMQMQSPEVTRESNNVVLENGEEKEGDWKTVEASPALRRKARTLCKRFGDVPKEDVVLGLLEGLHGSVEKAVHLLREAGLKETKCTEKVKIPIAPSSNINAKGAGPSSSSHANGVDLQCLRVMPRSTNEMSQQQFEKLYYEQRKVALGLKGLEDQLYKRAAEAYQNGDRSLAKSLSLQVCV